jgi:hypothetical protein
MANALRKYKACVVGCSRMGAFIDNEIPLQGLSLSALLCSALLLSLSLSLSLLLCRSSI